MVMHAFHVNTQQITSRKILHLMPGELHSESMSQKKGKKKNLIYILLKCQNTFINFLYK